MPRIAIIDRNKCTREKCGYLCMKLCPGVRMGDDTVTIDAEGWPVISEVLCTGCGICPKRCPVDAIKIINTPAEVGTPIFQYGVNTFRLYGLPLPQKGVVGLIGKNGIGKTTALQLLTAALKPNFGIVGSEAKGPEGLSWGTENAAKKSRGRIPLADEKSEDAKSGKKILGIQERQYFEALSGKKIKVALKPQNVDRIPAAFGGKVETLLKKLDEREALDEAVGLFELEHALGKTTKELSGGELQRVAVAACYIKDADIYYFDEPASYLDIEQRLIVAKAIRGLAEKHGKKVIVIEHDMALFDYLSDYVYVFYGEENTYGVCSGVKATRNGVNEYLDGYLKDENVRFRENEIRFDAGAGGERKSREKLAYPSMKKRYPKFSFECEAGSIREGEIVGVVGRNATGKSLFVKMLAGVVKPDSGGTDGALKVSYKPQYISYEGEEKVGELFSRHKLNSAVFEEARRRLELSGLQEKRLDQLSGGELQRVAITLALSQEADLYLFDEPSAYLDIEQRLHFSHLLHSIIESGEKAAFVVDHDIALVDAVATRLMVFEGTGGQTGRAGCPKGKKDGLNGFLKMLGITMRRDKDSGRPRINKPDSALDREQKESGEHYSGKAG